MDSSLKYLITSHIFIYSFLHLLIYQQILSDLYSEKRTLYEIKSWSRHLEIKPWDETIQGQWVELAEKSIYTEA